MKRRETLQKTSIFMLLCVLVVVFVTPIFFVIMNSFKGAVELSFVLQLVNGQQMVCRKQY